MKVLVVDDEAPARRRLIRMLESHDDVEVVAEAQDGLEALERLESHAPDLILLDIQMPGLDGLAMARGHGRVLPTLIFVTAHDEHALAAFEVGAVDYLLKPVTRERLAAALERVRTRPAASAAEEALAMQATLARLLGAAPVTDGRPMQRVGAREGASVRLFPVAEIGRFWSADKYTLFRHGGDEHLLDDSLNELELRLGPQGFVRVHRSELVDLRWVVALHQDDAGLVLELRDGQRVGVSRRMVARVKRELGL